MRRAILIFGISGYVNLVTLYCHAIFFFGGGRGGGGGGGGGLGGGGGGGGGGGADGFREGWVKIMLIVSCLKWLTYLFTHKWWNSKAPTYYFIEEKEKYNDI